jgi:hypothetical protein
MKPSRRASFVRCLFCASCLILELGHFGFFRARNTASPHGTRTKYVHVPCLTACDQRGRAGRSARNKSYGQRTERAKQGKRAGQPQIMNIPYSLTISIRKKALSKHGVEKPNPSLLALTSKGKKRELSHCFTHKQQERPEFIHKPFTASFEHAY